VRAIRRVLYDGVLAIRGARMYEAFDSLKNSQFSDLNHLERMQSIALASLLSHAREETEFYANYPSLSVDDALHDLRRLPLITKQDLISQKDRLRALRRWCPTFQKTTGGSTGEPVTVYKDPRSFGAEIAAAWRGLSWAGIDVGDRQARFWGVPSNKSSRWKAELIDYIGNRRRISAFDFDAASLEITLEELVSFEPKYFYGYVSTLREFANYCQARQVRHRLRPKAIVTTAEILDPQTRVLLQDTFGCRVYEEYGCGEVGTIAHECEYGALHLNAENVLLEVVNTTEKNEGALKEFVVTDLKNRAMPLIRYRVGDLGQMSSRSCPCGRFLPIIDKVVGRAYDVVTSPSGRQFHPEFFVYIFEDAARNGHICRGFQVEQTGPVGFTVRLLRPITMGDALERFILKRLRGTFDPSTSVKFVVVDQLQREPSGKMRVVKVHDDCLRG